MTMSEVGTQLVENEAKRKECHQAAWQVSKEIFARLTVQTDEQIAGLKIDELTALLQKLAAAKWQMVNLVAERAELAARA